MKGPKTLELRASHEIVAPDSAEFNAKKREEKYRDEWFGANWANIALQNGFTPNRDECLGWKVAPVLGGPFSVEDIQVFADRLSERQRAIRISAQFVVELNV